MYSFAISITIKPNTMKQVFYDLMNQISGINESTNSLSIAENIISAYKRGYITPIQFEMIAYDFERKCSTYGIQSYNECYYTQLHTL